MAVGTGAMNLSLSRGLFSESGYNVIYPVIRKIINRWPFLKAIGLILNDLWWGIKLRVGIIETKSGTIHAKTTLEESVRYIEEVFSDYKRYGGLTNFEGVAAEVGPGDNAGVALLMRQDGCRQVDLVDRYFSIRDAEKQYDIYDLLSNKYQLEWLKLGMIWNDKQLSGIVPRIGQPAEIYFFECAQNRGQVYDAIVSRAVLEHLYDPLGALEHMVFCLKSGGRMIHKVDLRDHGLFTPGHHELTFLNFPSPIYKWMTQNSGRPNRVMFHRYREVLERLRRNIPFTYSVFVTRLASIGDLMPHQLFEDIDEDTWHKATSYVDNQRQYFAKEFREADSRDLAVAGIFLNVIRQ